jgi:hypothetical protein
MAKANVEKFAYTASIPQEARNVIMERFGSTTAQ